MPPLADGGPPLPMTDLEARQERCPLCPVEGAEPKLALMRPPARCGTGAQIDLGRERLG